jgi:hypothetical protein
MALAQAACAPSVVGGLVGIVGRPTNQRIPSKRGLGCADLIEDIEDVTHAHQSGGIEGADIVEAHDGVQCCAMWSAAKPVIIIQPIAAPIKSNRAGLSMAAICPR